MNKIEIKENLINDFKSKESFKALRTNLLFCGTEFKVVGITSCTANEGKSSVCVNLASSIAESGKRVLLIDADMRKSVLAGRYKINRGVKGLSHYLTRQAELEDVICATDVKNFHMILAGQFPPNPAELLGNKVFKELVKGLKPKYDYIIIDNAPLGSVIDAAVVAQVCDGMILTIAWNAISYKFAQNIMAQLEKTGCPVLGTILNKVDVKKKMSIYGSYGGYGVYGDY